MNLSRRTSPSSLPILVVSLLTLGTFACKSTKGATEAPPQQIGRADLSNDVDAKAVVTAVDPATRQITLRRDDGTQTTVTAGPAVRNFDQIAAGDTLHVRYHEALTATLRPSSEGTMPAKGAVVAGSASKGATPAGGVGVAASVRVRIASVDRTNSIVVFALDSGEMRTVRAARPEGKAFVQTLNVGDIVQLDYASSMALAIEKL